MPILLDTESVAPARRVGYWQQAFRRIFNARVQVDSGTEEDFQGRMSIHEIDRIAVGEFISSPMLLSTQPAATHANLLALIVERGTAVIEQDDQQGVLHGRELVLCAGGRPFHLKLSTPARVTSLQVPEQEFLDMFPQSDAARLVPLRADTGTAALFADQVDSVLRCGNSLGGTGLRDIADSMLHLLGAVASLALTGHGEDRLSRRISERRERVRRFVRSQLRNPELNVEMIARAMHLSVRQIHRLFASEPLSIMQWVLAQRLENCCRNLYRPDNAGRPISEIAYEWGFSDHAYFSRVFRKQFNASPSEMRRRMLVGDGTSADPEASETLFPSGGSHGIWRFKSRNTSR